jgi:hypothetical protein
VLIEIFFGICEDTVEGLVNLFNPTQTESTIWKVLSVFPFDDTNTSPLSSSSVVGKGIYWTLLIRERRVFAEELSLVGQAWARVAESQADVEWDTFIEKDVRVC